MCTIKIDLDRYKEFFVSQHGLEFITQIMVKGDYDTIKEIVEWKQCTAVLLDEIAKKFIASGYDSSNLEILEEIVESSRVSKKTLIMIFDFASSLLDEYSEEASEVLEEIAESKKIDDELAWKLYNLAIEHKLWCVIEELAENDVTPDELLFDIIDRFEDDIVRYQEAYNQIIKRYKELKQQLNGNEKK